MVEKLWAGWFPGMKITTTEPEPNSVPSTKISVKDVREERPQFKREYRADLPGGRRLTVTARTSYGRNYSGELTQPGGRYVWFEPERVADKILDPELVPIIQRLCREIFQIDDAYVAQKPKSFTDESGTTWQRL